MTRDESLRDEENSPEKTSPANTDERQNTAPEQDQPPGRTYLQITPTDTEVRPGSVESQFSRLFDAAWEHRPEPEGIQGRLARVFGESSRTMRSIEWLVVTDGDSSQPLRYYVGLTSAKPKAPEDPQESERTDGGARVAKGTTPATNARAEAIDELSRLVRAVFPNDYSIDRVDWHPAWVLDAGRTEADGHRPNGTEADATDEGSSAHEKDQPTDVDYGAVEYVGRVRRRRDWQTRLTPMKTWLTADATARPPLNSVVAALAGSDVPTVYQALLTPMPSWAGEVTDRRYDLLEGRDSLVSAWARDMGLGSDEYAATNREKLEKRRGDDDDFLRRTSGSMGSPVHRIRTIETRDAERSFVVNARVVARGPAGVVAARCERLARMLNGLSGPYHRVSGRHRTGKNARALRDDLCTRTVYDPEYERPRTRVPGVASTSRGIVADVREAPGFCLIDGGSLTPEAMEGIAPTPGERARPDGPPPSRDLLTRYQEGLTLGRLRAGWTTGIDASGGGVGYHARTDDETESFVVRLPPDLQRLHIAWFGKTGSGKSTSGSIGLLDNHEVTDGATIAIDQKGDGLSEEIMRMQFARTGSLDDVIHFDCTELLPAFSFFDIRDQIAAGVPRETAVEDVVAHYEEILAQLHDEYHAAAVSVKLIEAVLKALFDPVHGHDAFGHQEFRATLSWMMENQTTPACSDDRITTVLENIVMVPQREFRNIMTGVMNRVDEVTVQKHLEPTLSHVHATTSADTAAAGTGSGTEGESPSEPTSTATAGEHEHEGDDGAEDAGEDENAHEHRRDTHHRRDAEGSDRATPRFDLLELLDENVIIIFDMGGLRSEAQRAMTLLILSILWTALRRRVHRRQRLYGHGRDQEMGGKDGRDEETGQSQEQSEDSGQETESEPNAGTEHTDRAEHTDADGPVGADELPLVNLHVEEASTVAATGIFSDLLKQARSFGCSVTLSMQYPAQLKHADSEAYDEVLNNVSTIVTGNVPLDRDLAARLATEDMDPQEAANRLRALSRGEWLCALPAGFGEVEPRPFVLESAPLPPGHPEGPHPLSESEELHFEVARVRSDARTRREYGLALTRPTVREDTTTAGQDARADEKTSDDGENQPEDQNANADSCSDEADRRADVDSALPYTLRLPPTVTYAPEQRALECTECENRYDPSDEGMIRAINCCSALSEVNADDIPITTVNLKLSRQERAETGLTDTQLMALQTIHNAQQLRYSPPAYDLLYDSMIRLFEYVGATAEDVQTLVDAGYLTHDTDYPHRLYSVTPQGRHVIGEGFRQGVDYGHGMGDLEETSAHKLLEEAARRFLVREYVEDPASSVVRVVPYYEVEDGHRLDCVGLDADGEIVVVVEAERVNNDIARAVPEDYDKMAACDPEEAIWVVMTTSDAHDVIEALADPLEGEPRIEKTYSRTTMPQEFRFDAPGLTDLYPIKHLFERLE